MDTTLVQTLIAVLALALLAMLIFTLQATRQKTTEEAIGAPPTPHIERRRRLAPLSVSEATEGLEAIAAQPPAPADGPVLEPPATPFYEETLDALEALFDRFRAGEMTLAAYVDKVRAHETAVAQRGAVLAERRSDAAVDQIALEQEIDDLLCARDAVRWCQDWADTLPRGAAPANDDADDRGTRRSGAGDAYTNRIAAGPSAAK